MRKILLTISLVVCVMCLFAITAFAATEVGGIWYNLNADGTATVTNDNATKCTLVDVVIPETFTHEGITYTVTTINDHAFSGTSGGWGKNQIIKTLVIPSTVTSIGAHFLRECKSVEKVTIYASDIDLYDAEFYNCTGLKEVYMAESAITSLGGKGNTFTGCSSLVTVELNAGLKGIPSACFKGCSSLVSIDIPETVTYIDSWAFNGCSKLSSLKLPAGLISISNNSIQGTGIKSIVIPHSIQKMAADVFPSSPISLMVLPAIDESISFDGGFLHNVYPRVIIYAGDNYEWLISNKYDLRGYVAEPFENYNPSVTPSKNTIYYGATTCSSCNGLLTDEGFNFTSLTEGMFTGSMCTNCGKQNVKESYKAVIECLGYSKSLTTGSMVQGFIMNKESVDALEENGYNVGSFGVLAVAVDTLGGSNVAFDDEGNAKDGVVLAEGGQFVYDIFAIKVTNIPLEGSLPNGTAYTDALLYMCAYIELDGVIKYISSGVASETLNEAISYNAIKE